jgi:SAM-dependent methyltransferase
MNLVIELGAPCTEKDQFLTISKRLNWIKGFFNENNNSIILDIGCGYGIYERELSRFGRTIGLDIYYENLKRAVNNSKSSDFIWGVSEALPFQNECIDHVIMVEVLEHVDDPNETLTEIFRVLKPGGLLLITVPNRGFPFLTHSFKIIRIHEGFFGFPLPLATYLPMPILKRIWLARHYRMNELKELLFNMGFLHVQSSFIMPSFEASGSIGLYGKVPFKIRKSIQSMFSSLDFNENAWFGVSLAIAVKK